MTALFTGVDGFVLTCSCQKLKKSGKVYWMFADRKYGPQPVQVTVTLLISTQIFPARFHVLSYHTDEENSCLNQIFDLR